MDGSIITSIIAVSGAIIVAALTYFFTKSKELSATLNELNEEKYRSMLIYMSLVLNPNNLSHFVMNDDLLKKMNAEKIPKYSIDKLREYYYHSILYASDEVLEKLKIFIANANRENYINTALAMRKHLWGKKTIIKEIKEFE